MIGTRAAMFAPVDRLGLVAIWDDGDDLHSEPRAPTRTPATCCSPASSSPRPARWSADTPHRRGAAAAGDRLGAGGGRRPGHRTGPYPDHRADRRRPQLARDPGPPPPGCPAWPGRPPATPSDRTCRCWCRCPDAATCRRSPAPSAAPRPAARTAPARSRCPRPAAPGLPVVRPVDAAYACPECGGRRLRAAVTGARRTAEELGRAFPGVSVRTSGREEVLTDVPGGAALVVATPGAEPVAEGGYGAVLLLDSWALLTRADLRAGEEALRRWLAAAALAAGAGRPGGGGRRRRARPVQALLRWDAAWFAGRELAERRELGFPPAVRMASVTGAAEAVADLLAAARLPDDAEVLGPVPAEEVGNGCWSGCPGPGRRARRGVARRRRRSGRP
ncbi:primosomal protein N' [Micromonospora sp. M12]